MRTKAIILEKLGTENLRFSRDAYAYDITQSLAENGLINDEEFRQIRTYLADS